MGSNITQCVTQQHRSQSQVSWPRVRQCWRSTDPNCVCLPLHLQIAVNKRSWPSSALFEPDALLSSVAKPLQTGAPGEKFRLYLLDTATTSSSSSSVAWPEHAVAVVYTSYSGYLPYVHGLSDDRNATVSAVALARFAALAVSVGDPSGVAAVRSGDELLDLIDTVDPPRPVMAFFSAFASPHSVRARPFFEAAAALYGRQLPFAEVRCSGRGSSEVLAALCSKLNVTSFPTLGLYTVRCIACFCCFGDWRNGGRALVFRLRSRRFHSCRNLFSNMCDQDAHRRLLWRACRCPCLLLTAGRGVDSFRYCGLGPHARGHRAVPLAA